MSRIFETLLKKHSNSEKILISHRNFKVKYKDIFKPENIDLKKINSWDVVALIGDYNSFTIKIFLNSSLKKSLNSNDKLFSKIKRFLLFLIFGFEKSLLIIE